MAFAEQPVIVCETFLVGKGHFNSDISNLASKASEWLATRVRSRGSWIVAIAVCSPGGDCGAVCGRCRAVCSLGAGNAKVVGSSPTVVVRVGVTARGGTGTPAQLY